MAKNSPCMMSSVTPSTAGLPPKNFRRSCKVMDMGSSGAGRDASQQLGTRCVGFVSNFSGARQVDPVLSHHGA
jgi:hypothetical protein